MIKRCAFLLIAIWFSFQPFNLLAQTKLIVVDQSTQEKLPSAHILFKDKQGRNQAVLTNLNGEASFSIQDTLTVEVRYLGYTNTTILLKPNSIQTLSLKTDETQLDEFVVTGQYKPNSPDKAVQKVRVINRTKIENMAAVSLDEVLANEMNIRISRDGVLGTSMSMQGVSGENVKVMIDGVPVIGRLNGDIDLSQILLQDVERIEVIEGPSSVNYGTNALAGTINIITVKGKEAPTKVSGSFYGESIGTYNSSVALNTNIGKRLQVSFSGARNLFNGWSPGDSFEPNAEKPIADETRVQQWNPKTQWFGNAHLTYRKNKTNIGYKFGYFDEQIINRGAPREPYFETAFDDYYNTTRIDNAVFIETPLGSTLKLNSVFGYNHFERIKETVSKNLTTLEETPVSDQSLLDTTTFQTFMNRSNFIFDFDNSWLNAELGYDINVEEARGKRIDGGTKTQGDYAIFATAEARFKNVVVKPGIRATYNTQYAAPVTPSINLKYDVGPWIFRGSYAQGFRAPALKELYFDFVDVNHNIVGNEDLKAEYSHNITLGAIYKYLRKQHLIQVEWGGYFNKFENLIELAVVDPVEQAYAYVNVGESQTMGTQLNVSWVWEHIKAQAGLNYIGIANQFEGMGMQPFNFYPEANLNATYTWHKSNTSLSVFYKYQGERPITSQVSEELLETQTIDAYSMMDVTVSQKLWKKRITLSTGVKNVFDIWQISGSSSSGGVHAGGSSFPISTGRLMFVKLNFQWAK